MDIKKWMRKTSEDFYSINAVAAWIGCIIITAIILLVFVDVCGRYLLNKPLQGSYELVEQAMCVLAGFAIMYTAAKGGHVAIDVIRFSRRTQGIMQRVFSLLGSGISVALAYRVCLCAVDQVKKGETTDVLRVPLAPFTFMLAVPLFLCGLTLLIQTFHAEASEETKEGKERGINEP